MRINPDCDDRCFRRCPRHGGDLASAAVLPSNRGQRQKERGNAQRGRRFHGRPLHGGRQHTHQLERRAQRRRKVSGALVPWSVR